MKLKLCVLNIPFLMDAHVEFRKGMDTLHIRRWINLEHGVFKVAYRDKGRYPDQNLRGLACVKLWPLLLLTMLNESQELRTFTKEWLEVQP